ncbi:MAG: ECF transporter S component [Firmicutes bacterium]|nr:ECF transporter S component [Bacillota bacterium]
MKTKTRMMTSVAMFVALGILLPMVFHAVGLGKVFLPMHIPVFLSGILCGPVSGLVTGVVTPILSAVLTGMPALAPPVAQAMVFELGLYGLLSGVFAHRLNLSALVSLVLTMAAGRVVYGLLAAFALPVLGFKPVPVSYPITAALLASMPGVILQIVVVPVVVTLARRAVSKRAGGNGEK